MKNENILIVLLIVLVIVLGGYYLMKKNKTNKTDSINRPLQKEAKNSQQMEINKNKKYSAILNTTKGEITIEFFSNKTPITVNNFITLARKGFYNKTVFHRIIKGFMIQGGDPNGDGTGGPGYKFNDEAFEGEYKRGTMAMANAGPNTNGSQFFIMHQDYDLPKNYVIFGQVVKGIDVVDKIAESEVEQSSSGENSKPTDPISIESIQILEK
jgi:cyclophilin family peptidyl-prolyl cis-trans isomerase